MPKSVCTAEQKIAYNIAFMDRDWAKRTNMEYAEYLLYTANRLKRDHQDIIEKYDIDAIIHCLRQGVIEYWRRPGCGVLWDYEEIGKTFPTLYPVE